MPPKIVDPTSDPEPAVIEHTEIPSEAQLRAGIELQPWDPAEYAEICRRYKESKDALHALADGSYTPPFSVEEPRAPKSATPVPAKPTPHKLGDSSFPVENVPGMDTQAKPKINDEELDAAVKAALATGDHPSATQLHEHLAQTFQVDRARVVSLWHLNQQNRT